jgi:glycerate kinase
MRLRKFNLYGCGMTENRNDNAEKTKEYKCMKVVIAIDSLKGSLTSLEAGNAAKEGVLKAHSDAEVIVMPLADGGEGTTDALIEGLGGERQIVEVTGPMSDKVQAYYGILGENDVDVNKDKAINISKDTINKKVDDRNKEYTAVMEMATAAGITLVNGEKNPLVATTFGVGEMILDAINKGCREFIIGIGGSATNDGGMGMLKALGYEFLDKNGNEVAEGAAGLFEVAEIREKNIELSNTTTLNAAHTLHMLNVPNTPNTPNTPNALNALNAQNTKITTKVLPNADNTNTDKINLHKVLSRCKFKIACDVNNPLCGENGATYIFGPQKGVTEAQKEPIDKAMKNYADVVTKFVRKDFSNVTGAGAAGGLGFVFVSFLGAELVPGVALICEAIHLEEVVKEADIVVTGEGRLDAQTMMGKAPAGVANIAKKYNKKVLAFAGSVSEDATQCNSKGIDAFFPIIRGVSTLEAAMDSENAAKNMTDTVEQVFRLC